MVFDLALIGYGNVAKRFVTLVDEHRDALKDRYGIAVRVIGIATRRGGPRYLDAEFRPTRATAALGFIREACARDRRAARDGRLVVVETTTLDVTRGQPAIDHIRAALAGGAHVITANKGPVAFAYRSLARAAERAGRAFLFESAVMDGVPIFNLVRETLPAVEIRGFRGIVNSTTNYILTAMEEGQPFAEALAEMQASGIAEADASLDVDGWDAAAKTAALANVLLGASITPHDVQREGISAGTSERLREATAAGRRLKLVASASREGKRVVSRVAPTALPATDLLAGVEGQQNALLLNTDLVEEIAIVQRGGGLTQTAYGLLSDLITIARARRQPPPSAHRRRSPSPRGRR
ncbi:MAG TPA: homoserine dehydrogenase [Vicinamibacterales bacterium]|nr:homoserine dehydrogenase [Vicinamibacterales bacterium]